MEEPKSKAKRGAKTAAAAQENKITLLPLSELHDFPNHPFKVRDDEAMQETTESIRQYGVLVPAIVRPREDGGYEIIAGHRRRHGSELAGASKSALHRAGDGRRHRHHPHGRQQHPAGEYPAL